MIGWLVASIAAAVWLGALVAANERQSGRRAQRHHLRHPHGG
jgi:hypothetical protein